MEFDSFCLRHMTWVCPPAFPGTVAGGLSSAPPRLPRRGNVAKAAGVTWKSPRRVRKPTASEENRAEERDERMKG